MSCPEMAVGDTVWSARYACCQAVLGSATIEKVTPVLYWIDGRSEAFGFVRSIKRSSKLIFPNRELAKAHLLNMIDEALAQREGWVKKIRLDRRTWETQ